MKKIVFVVYFCLAINFGFAQKFEKSLYFSHEMTFCSNKSYECNNSIGFSVAFRESCNISKNMSIASEIIYSNCNYKIQRGYEGVATPEFAGLFQSKVNLQSFSIPLIFKFKTNNNLFLETGYSLNCKIYLQARIIFIEYDCNREVERTEVPIKPGNSGNYLNDLFFIGFGKEFSINRTKLSAGFYYERALHNYQFAHGVFDSYRMLYVYDIQPQEIGWRLGVIL